MQRKTALVALELDKYGVDIAGIQEARLIGVGSVVESNYTFFWSGHESKKVNGVAIVMKASLTGKLVEAPRVINERLMTARLPIQNGKHLCIICAYAPTMMYDDHEKEVFYEQLNTAINAHRNDKLVLVGDFNARVGNNHMLWPDQIGHHGVGKCNSNGMLLLTTCAQHELCLTNTWFKTKEIHKCSWQHPRSKHWHLLDYIIVRRQDLQDVCLTRVYRAAECGTDHRLVISKIKIRMRKVIKYQGKRKRLNLNIDQRALQDELQNKIPEDMENLSIEENWQCLSKAIYDAAQLASGRKASKSPDWFNENEDKIRVFLDERDAAKQMFLRKETRANKVRFHQAKQRVKRETRRLKSEWMIAKAKEIQTFAICQDWKNFYQAVKVIYGPRKGSSTCALKSAIGNEVIRDQKAVADRWKEHFSELLNRPTTVNEDAIKNIRERPMIQEAAAEPTRQEVVNAIGSLANGKAAGSDGIPAEIYKQGGDCLIDRVFDLLKRIWSEEKVPQEFKNANIVTIYKNKGNRMECGNHRGISLLVTAGKILTKIIQRRFVDSFMTKDNLSETQCGFRQGRSTIDMLFSVRQLQEKCAEQQVPLYGVFVDLAKAFDSEKRGTVESTKKIWLPRKVDQHHRRFT